MANSMANLDHDRRNKHPRLLAESERDRLEEFIEHIHYSSRCISAETLAALSLAHIGGPDIPMTSLNIDMCNYPRTC